MERVRAKREKKRKSMNTNMDCLIENHQNLIIRNDFCRIGIFFNKIYKEFINLRVKTLENTEETF